MYGYIYRITDLTNGKCYIGQHKYDKLMLDPKYHSSSRILKNQIKKHPENFLEEIIFIAATLEEANYFETYFIEHLNTLYPNGYNLNTGGDVRKATDESKRRQSEAQKGGKRSIETRQKMSEVRKGWIPSEETKQKMSNAQKGKRTGKDNSMYGVHRYGEQAPNYGKNKYGLTEEFLYEEYVNKNKSQSTIANELNCSQTLISQYLKQYKISKKSTTNE